MKSFYKAYNVTFIKFLDGNLRKHLEKDPVVFIKHYQEARTVLGNVTALTENLRNSAKHRKKKKKSKSKIEKNNGELKIIKSEPEREEKNQSKSSNSPKPSSSKSRFPSSRSSSVSSKSSQSDSDERSTEKSKTRVEMFRISNFDGYLYNKSCSWNLLGTTFLGTLSVFAKSFV